MGEQKTFNAQLSQRIHTMESSLNHKLDVLQSDLDQKIDILQYSISRLTNQHVHQEEESPEEECLSDTMVEEQCQQQLLFESSDIGVVVCAWEKKEAISPLLTEEGSGKEAVEEPQKHNLHLPSTNPMYILPTPTQSIPETPAAKAEANPFALPVQYFRKLVATIQTFATTSKTLAAAHVARHSRWLIPKPSWFRFRATGPQQLHQLHQFQQPHKA